MATSHTIEAVDKIVHAAAEQARIPVAPLTGFDGDAWLWKWRDRSLADRVAEVHFRVLSDVLTEELQTELFSYAELTVAPHTSRRSGVNSSRELSRALSRLVRDQAAEHECIELLQSDLAESWQQAHRDSELLEETDQRHRELRAKLEALIERSRKGNSAS